jgi:hypothetical protein
MMKRKFRLISTFACAAAMLFWTCAPVQAKTFGNLVRGQTFKLEVANDSTALVRGAVTVYWLKPGGILDIELLGATIPAVDLEIPRRATRVIYAVSPAPQSSVLFKLTQGPLVVEETVSADTTFVFEIVDAP